MTATAWLLVLALVAFILAVFNLGPRLKLDCCRLLAVGLALWSLSLLLPLLRS